MLHDAESSHAVRVEIFITVCCLFLENHPYFSTGLFCCVLRCCVIMPEAMLSRYVTMIMLCYDDL